MTSVEARFCCNGSARPDGRERLSDRLAGPVIENGCQVER